MPARALHLCTRYLRGGSEHRLVDAISSLPEVEHQVVVGDESDLALAREQLAPARVWREPALVRPVAPGRDLQALGRLVRLVRRGSFDIVYSHQSKAGTIGRAAAWLAGGPPTVHSLSMANFGPGYGLLEDRVFRLCERLLANRTTAYAVVGRDLARCYERIGVPPTALHVIRSSVSLPAPGLRRADARAALHARFGVPRHRPMVLSLGSLDARKGVLDLPEYLDEVAKRMRTRPFLLVAGDGPLRGALQARLDARGLASDARLVGHVSPVHDLVVGADLLVLLSTAEGLPQVLVQAVAAGTPFVAYEVDGVAELMDLGAAGTAVPLRDVEGAAEATSRHLDGLTPAQPASGRVASEALDAWSPDAITSAHRNLFEVATGIRLHARAAPSAAG